MKKYKAGSWLFYKDSYEYYTDDFETFYTLGDAEHTKEDLEEWAVTLNSPWSQADAKYTISLNCEDAYTPLDKYRPIWRCEYCVVGYDCVTATVFGYGSTEIEALEECKKYFQWLQDKYNPEDESF